MWLNKICPAPSGAVLSPSGAEAGALLCRLGQTHPDCWEFAAMSAGQSEGVEELLITESFEIEMDIINHFFNCELIGVVNWLKVIDKGEPYFHYVKSVRNLWFNPQVLPRIHSDHFCVRGQYKYPSFHLKLTFNGHISTSVLISNSLIVQLRYTQHH